MTTAKPPLSLSLWFWAVGLAVLAVSFWLDGEAAGLAVSYKKTPFSAGLALAAYWLGLGGTQLTALALLLVLHWIQGKKSLAKIWLGGIWAVSVSGILSQVVKHLIGRPRPRLNLAPLDLSGPTWLSDMHSFPSGHATTSFALAAVLSARFPRAAWAFYLAAALVGLGRVVGTSHYPSDVIGGVLLGLAVGIPLGNWATGGRSASA